MKIVVYLIRLELNDMTLSSSKMKQNTNNITYLTLMAYRCGVGNATAAMLLNSYLEGIDITNSSNIFDKVQLSRRRVRH